MAENDIVAFKELASGGFVERVLTPADISAAAATHASTHHTGGSDAIAPNNIGAAWALVLSSENVTGDITLSSGRNRRISLAAANVTANVDLPSTGNEAGDVVTLVALFFAPSTLTIRRPGGTPSFVTVATMNANGQSFTFVSDGTATGWSLRGVDTHASTHATGGSDALTPANIGAAKEVTEIEVPNNGTSTTTLTTGQLPARVIIFVDANAAPTATINLPTPGVRQSGLLASIKVEIESGSAASALVTVVHDATTLLNSYELDADQNSIDFLWDGYAWTYSGTFLLRSYPNRVLQLPAASGTIALTSQLATGSTDNAILRADGTGGAQTQASDLVIDDYTSSSQGNITLAPRSVSFSCTAEADDDFVTATGHTFVNGDQVTFTSLTGGGGLATRARYFVRDAAANVFKVASTSTGAAINITTDATAGTVQRITALVLDPRNIGALVLGPKPDGTVVGGDARGIYAVDLQVNRVQRNDPAAVASGDLSFIAGSENSQASARFASIIGCGNATASGFRSMALACADSNINGTFCIGIGGAVGAQSRRSITMFGQESAGFGQTILAQPTQRTTTDAAVELSCNGTNGLVRFTIPSGFIHHYFIIITGVRSTGAASAHYMRQYAIKNVGGTTSEVFAPVTIGTDTASGTSISITANDTNDALKIECTGILNETWRWHAQVHCTEMQYGT